ncbi:MAG: hypothetical protein JST76_11470, partial [Bacteroidetes bacterium]|nr:hypothetical protein [Bacteroidota bacterium]
MKKFLFVVFFLLLGSTLFSAKIYINDSTFIEGEIVASSPTCSIIAVKENNVIVYYVLSEIANALLPEAAKQLCLIVVGHENQEICEVLYEGIEFVTS